LAPDRGFGEAVQNGWLPMYSDYINENLGAILEFYSENIAANSKSTILQTLLNFREQSIVRVTVSKAKEWPKSCLCDLNRRVIGQSNEQVPFK
jgi:hypothetical protein